MVRPIEKNLYLKYGLGLELGFEIKDYSSVLELAFRSGSRVLK